MCKRLFNYTEQSKWPGCNGINTNDLIPWYDPQGNKRSLALVKLGHKTLSERYCSWAAKAEAVIFNVGGQNGIGPYTNMDELPCNITRNTWNNKPTTLKDWYLDGDNYVEVNPECPFFEIYPTTMDMMIHNNWLGRCSGTDEDEEYNWFVTFEGKAFATEDDNDGAPESKTIFTTTHLRTKDTVGGGTRDQLWNSLPWYKSFGPYTEDQIRSQWSKGDNSIDDQPMYSFPYHYHSETENTCPHWRLGDAGSSYQCKDYDWMNINEYGIDNLNPSDKQYVPERGQITGLVSNIGKRYSSSDEFRSGSFDFQRSLQTGGTSTNGHDVVRTPSTDSTGLTYAMGEFHRDGWAVNMPMKDLKFNGVPLDEYAYADTTNINAINKVQGGVWKAWKMRFGGDAMCTKCRCGANQFLTKACDGGDFRNRIGGDEEGEELSIEALIHGYQFSPCCSYELEKWINEQTVGGAGQTTNEFRCGINNCNPSANKIPTKIANMWIDPFSYQQIESIWNQCIPANCWSLVGSVFIYQGSACKCPQVNILGDTADVYLNLKDEFNEYSGYNNNFEKNYVWYKKIRNDN